MRKGTIVDATMIESTNRPMKSEKQQQTEVVANPQKDTDARSTKKGNRHYFGYKGHIGVDMGSKLINRRIFTPANEHDSKFTEELANPEAEALFGDKAYGDDWIKKMARQFGWFYCIQDTARKGQKLSGSQVKRNTRMGRIRAAVEHPFAWMKTQAGGLRASCRSKIKNALTFDFNCMCWNLKQAGFLLARHP